MPTADGATTGGAINTAIRVMMTDVASNGTVNVVSSSASDTAAVITTTGRDATGTIQSEAKTSNGTTPVSGAQTFERILKSVASGTTAVGDLADEPQRLRGAVGRRQTSRSPHAEERDRHVESLAGIRVRGNRPFERREARCVVHHHYRSRAGLLPVDRLRDARAGAAVHHRDGVRRQ